MTGRTVHRAIALAYLGIAIMLANVEPTGSMLASLVSVAAWLTS